MPNNPATLTDPFGLAPCNWHNASGRSQEDLALLAGFGGEENGVVSGCGLVFSELSSGAAAACPDNAWSGFRTNGSGKVSFAHFRTFDLGLSGYFKPSDLTSAINDFDSAPYSSDWQTFLSWVYAGFISAQRQRLLANLAKLKYVNVTVSRQPLFIKGGHANFRLKCGMGPKCCFPAVGRYAYGVHVAEPGIVHNDTVSPWTGRFSFLDVFSGSFWEHLLVDLIGGSFTTVFPQ